LSEKEKKENKKCNVCGADIKAGSYYCHKCGRKVQEEWKDIIGEAEIKEVSERGNKSGKSGTSDRLILWVAVIILIVSISVSGILIGNKTKRDGERVPKLSGDLSSGTPSASLAIESVPAFYLGEGCSTGPDPRGEISWLIDLGDSVVSPPVYDGGVIYIVTEEAREIPMPGSTSNAVRFYSRLQAIDAGTGNMLWASETFGIDKIRQSEIFTDGTTVYVLAASREVGILIVGFDTTTGGEEVWPRGFFAEEAEFIGAAMASDIIGVCLKTKKGEYALNGVSTLTGESRWYIKLPGEPSVPEAFGKYLTFIENHQHSGSLLMDASNASVTILDGPSGLTVYKKEVGFPDIWASPVMIGGKLLTGGPWAAGRLMVECHDLDNPGSPILWQWDDWLHSGDLPPPGIIALGDKAVFIGPLNKPIIVSLEDGSVIPLEFNPAEPLLYPPISNGKLLFVADESGITSIDPVSGITERAYTFPYEFEPKADSHMIYANGRIYCPGRNGRLLAVV